MSASRTRRPKPEPGDGRAHIKAAHDHLKAAIRWLLAETRAGRKVPLNLDCPLCRLAAEQVQMQLRDEQGEPEPAKPEGLGPRWN